MRIALHERFSTNPYPWLRWVFDHFEFPPAGRILEVGCGTARLWLDNAQRVNPAWEVILSDRSAGMLRSARANVQPLWERFGFGIWEAACLPYGDGQFEAVIANHMLYYAVDVDQTLAEVRRVLKPGGKLYASTNGLRHLKEIDDLIVGFRGGARPIASVVQAFSLENGREFLERHFAGVRLERQENGLRVTDAAMLAQFGLSVTKAGIPEARQAEFVAYVERALAAHGGEMPITKDGGLFVGVG